MPTPQIPRRLTILTWLFGVLLPAGTLFYERFARFCAQHLFDPLPSFLHVVVVACVPFGFLMILNGIHPSDRLHRHVPTILGSILAISLIYTLPFVPLLGVAVVALLFYGLGFLPLAPLLAWLVGIGWAWRLHKGQQFEAFGRRLGIGALVGLALFLVADTRRLVTHVAVEMVVTDAAEANTAGSGLESLSNEGQSQRRAMWLLRHIGDRGQLLKLCRRQGPKSMLYTSDIDSDAARELYFRVTGQAVASDWDSNTWRSFQETLKAGSTTWDQNPNLSLETSHLKAALDPSAPMAYVQWEMVFANTAGRQAEARAEIALPAGARVSRVTLWIEDEPREAAFGGRAQVTDAYEDVVIVQNKDPLLVTTAGPDRVRMRAFPVPVQGKIRLQLGITAPLDVVRAIEARLDLPYFTEKNFQLAERSRHRIELMNTGRAQRLHTPRGLENPFQMTDAQLASFETFVAIHRDDRHNVFRHGEDPQQPQAVARLVEGQMPRPRHVVLVVDGSGGIEPYRSELLAVVDRLHAAWPEMEILLASDTVPGGIDRWQGQATAGDGSRGAPSARQWLAAHSFAGGQDNTFALREAIELARSKVGAAVLWVGGRQPVSFSSQKALRGTLEGGPVPPIFVLPLEPGALRLWDAFEIQPRTVLPRYGTLVDDLMAFPGLDASRKVFELRFDSQSPAAPVHGLQVSDHLERLSVAQTIDRLLRRTDDSRAREQALQLAVKRQLVTPVSGAVVLETAEQYADHDLHPVSKGTVPTIPEPEIWALLLATLLAVLWADYRRRARQRAL